MDKNKGIAILTLLLLTLLLVGCANKGNTSVSSVGSNKTEQVDLSSITEDQLEDTLRYPITLTFASLDPHLVPTGGPANIGRHIYEQLVAFNSNYEVVPVLAKEVIVSGDGKTYTFPLRENIKFHNGKALTAEDVVASLNRWKSTTARVQTSFGESLFEEVDSHTVKITLAEPSNDVPLQLASYLQFSAITTKEAIEGAGTDGLKEFIGTGPFKLEEHKHDQYVHLTKYDDYVSPDGVPDSVTGKKEAFINHLYFDLIPDGTTAFNGFLAGDYDFASVTIDNLPQVQALPDVTVEKVFQGELNIVFNKKATFGSQQIFRQAIAKAINAEDILLGYTSDTELYRLNSSLMTPNNNEWYSEAGKEYYNQNNAEEAKKLLEEVGYNGEEIVFLTTKDSAGQFYNATLLVVDQLQKVGINAKIDTYDFTTMIAKRGEVSAWDIYVGSFANQVSPSQILFLGKSYGWPEDEKLQLLVKNTTTAITAEEKRKASDELHQYHWEYASAIKIGDTGTYIAYRNNVVGYNFFEGPILWNTKVLK